MTTIACDGKSMSCDGLITSGSSIIDTNSVKVFRCNNGSILGLSGDTHNWYSLLSYFNEEIKEWPVIRGDFSVLLLESNGAVFSYDETGRSWMRPTPTAIGSGRSYALGALDMGATTEEAVKIACNRDAYSGGTITTMSLK